jgi:hypothetical protein
MRQERTVQASLFDLPITRRGADGGGSLRVPGPGSSDALKVG